MSDKQKYTLGEAAAVGAIGTVVIPFFLAAIAIVSAPFVLWKAWVIVQLWAWFVVPYFHLPALSVWLVWGLLSLYGLITAEPQVKKTPDEINWKSTFICMATGPALSLAVGWAIHHYALHGR